jgi:hypothetical protein
MLEHLYEQLERVLSKRGEIADVLLCTERSVYEEDEQLEMKLYVSAGESGQPAAVIHLFPLDEHTCEVEVEITYDQINGQGRESSTLWAQAQEIVPEISFSEKKRYITADRLVEHELTLDFHFILSRPQDQEEERHMEQTLRRFADDLTHLLRL